MKSLIIWLSFLFALNCFALGGYYPWGDAHWQPPVPTVASLPASGNQPGDARTALDTFNIYVWTGLLWADQSGSGSVVPGGANTDVQYNNAGAFGGDAGFTYSSPGSFTLTNSGSASSITQNGNGGASLILVDTSVNQPGNDSIVFEGLSGTQIEYTFGSGPSLPAGLFSLYNNVRAENVWYLDAGDETHFAEQIFVANQVEIDGSFADEIINDTSGSNNADIYYENNGIPTVEMFSGAGNVWTLQDDTNEFLPILQFDPNDDAVIQNFSGGGSPALEVINNGSSPFSVSTNTGINVAGTTQMLTDGSGFAASNSFNWTNTGDIGINGVVNINPNDANGSDSFTLTDSRGPGFATNMTIKNPENSGININLDANMSVGMAATTFTWTDIDTGLPIGFMTNQLQGSDYVLSFNGFGNPGPAMLSIDETAFTVNMLTLELLGQAPAPPVSSAGNNSFYYDANTNHTYLSENGGAYNFVLTPNLDISSGAAAAALTMSFTGLTEGQLILGSNNDPSFDNWTDLQFLTRGGPGFGGLQYDIYTGLGSPHGSGHYTIWDSLTSRAMEDWNSNDDVSFGGSITALSGVTPNAPAQAQPGCGAGNQGMMWNLPQPGVGPDLFQVCQDTTGTGVYAWVTH